MRMYRYKKLGGGGGGGGRGGGGGGGGVSFTIAALEGSTPSISMHILIAAVFSTRSTDFNCWMYSQYLSIAADIEASSNNHNYNW